MPSSRADVPVPETTDAGLNPLQLSIKHARNPNSAALFNYASMAHNNEFFFNSLVRARQPFPNPPLA